MTRRPLALALAVALGWHGLPLRAVAETTLDTVSVEAETIDDVIDETATTNTITSEQISREMAGNIKSAVRYEPGVSVTNNPSRFGLSGFNIRGIDGDRIGLQIDGVDLPEEFQIGGFSNAGRNMVDVGLLKSITIQRGPDSVLFGSGAIGGAVSYVTPEPEDWLAPGKTLGGGIEAQYYSANDSAALIPTVAAGSDTLKFLLRVVGRSGHETETMGTLDVQGPDRTVANPQNDDVLSGIMKVALTPDPNLRTTLTLEGFAQDVDTDIQSIVRGTTIAASAEDRYRRQRISLDQSVDGLAIGALDIKLYYQTSSTTQDTFDDRSATNPPSYVTRGFEVTQDIAGLKAGFDSLFEAQGAHRMIWGLDLSRRKTEEIRTGEECYPTFDLCLPNIGIITYPDRDYPISTVDELGLYGQDTWTVSEAWTVLLGLRYDYYHLEPEADDIYLGVGRPPADQKPLPQPYTTDAFTPKIGAIWRFAEGYELRGRYVFGFRAPPFDDANFGFSNADAGYVSLPNPNLDSEYSQGQELSLLHNHASGSWSITAYNTDYENFIGLETLDCPNAPAVADPLCVPANIPGTFLDTFQPQNLEGVSIYGLEAGFTQMLAPNWQLRGSMAYARGREGDGNPIDSVNPFNGVLGIAYSQAAWQAEAMLTMAAAKNADDARHDDDGDLERQFLTDGYAVLDLRAHWEFAENGRLSFGILNATNHKYVLWSDVPVFDPNHIADSGAGADRYTQPGRNYTLNLSYNF
jgi:hemoglobin/transferrin/lactoferrin receptor protein